MTSAAYHCTAHRATCKLFSRKTQSKAAPPAPEIGFSHQISRNLASDTNRSRLVKMQKMVESCVTVNQFGISNQGSKVLIHDRTLPHPNSEKSEYPKMPRAKITKLKGSKPPLSVRPERSEEQSTKRISKAPALGSHWLVELTESWVD